MARARSTSSWRRRIAVAAGLSALLAACPAREPTRNACLEQGLQDLVAWRWVEPRLSGAFASQVCRRSLPAGHVVEVALCPARHQPLPPVSIPVESCDPAGRRQVEALRTLLLAPGETEEAVEMLASLAAEYPADALIASDLAAAYRVRAQRMDRPADLLSSWEAARRAAALSGPAAARFNASLADESLMLSAAAPGAATRWTLDRQRLGAAAQAGDRQAVARLIRPFPDATERWLEEEILPGWAESREEPEAQSLAVARTIADELARQTGDRYLAGVVGAIARASSPPRDPAKLRELRRGHLAFGRARLAERAQEWELAESEYRQALRHLSAAGSPLHAGADLGIAIAQLQRGEVPLPRVLARLAPLEAEACARDRRHSCGRTLWIRAFCLFDQGRALESLAVFDRARERFESMGDGENAANVRVWKAGILRVLGQPEAAWREVYQALSQLPRMVELQARHNLFGEAAATAQALGHPRIALLYQDRAVRWIEEDLAATPRQQGKRIEGLRVHLAIALRERAVLRLHDGHPELARADLDRVIRLMRMPLDATARRALEARFREVEGEALLASQPARAVESFRQARRLASPGEYHTFVANLSFELASAYRRLGQRDEAEQALVEGMGELRQEERLLLAGRQRGSAEELWSHYFSRFQTAYKLLIRLLVEDGRPDEAFAYAERARAFEPLNLVLGTPFAPEAFRALAIHGEPLREDEIRRHLPRGTFLIEYCVLDDRLLIWEVWRGGSAFLTRGVGRATLESWTREVQLRAGQRDAGAFERALAEPFADLVAAPLSELESARPGRIERLVFIPDGAIHGLPLAALHAHGRRRYLIEDYPVAVAPSATLYVFSLLRDRELGADRAPNALLVGNPALDTGSDLTRGLQPVPRAAEEVARIRSFYPRVKVLEERDATVSRFLELARESTVVHFGGHAIANSRSPFRSLLIFAPGDGQSGALPAEELLSRVELEKTRLVVLSACSGAGGAAIGPEGLAPLVRPLVAAGVPAVVGSLWDVGDEPTAELLVELHRQYAAGQDAGSALRLAQLHLIAAQNEGLRSPLAWAPFEVIGYASSPFP